jgi:4-hydroxy-tetrahydrodipicolinate reductase
VNLVPEILLYMKVSLIGYGKMGHAIEEIALQRGHEVIMRFDVDNQAQFTEENLRKAEVAIEFTNPHSAFSNLEACLRAGVPIVSGTTGWVEKLDQIKTLATEMNGSFLYASNFSVGVNIFFEVNKKLAELMAEQDDYEIQLTEVHHTQKKDAPSGTAISLAEQVLEKIKRKTKWVNQVSENPSELEIISERTDPAPGTHHVKYSSAVDDIEIIHTAHSRKGFASGAVLAAEFVYNKKGIFTMKDVLGF